MSTGMIVLSVDPLRYKIVRLSECCRGPKSTSKSTDDFFFLEVKVFDSDIWRWKQLDDVTMPYGEFLFHGFPAVSACGFLYWITSDRSLLVIDGYKETCVIRRLPQQFQNREDRVRITDYEGKLGVIKSREDCIELWVLENYSSYEWKMRLRTNLGPLERHGYWLEPFAFSNADVAIINGGYERSFFNVTKQKVDTVRYFRNFCSSGVFHLVSDFEFINLEPSRGYVSIRSNIKGKKKT